MYGHHINWCVEEIEPSIKPYNELCQGGVPGTFPSELIVLRACFRESPALKKMATDTTVGKICLLMLICYFSNGGCRLSLV